MDYDYWDKKSSSVILTQTSRQLSVSPTATPFFPLAPKALNKVLPNTTSSFCQFRSLTILSPASSLPRSSPLSSLGDFESGFSGGGSDGDFAENRYRPRQEFQVIAKYATSELSNDNNYSTDLIDDHNTSANCQFDYFDEKEEHQARSLMRQMTPVYNNNSQHSIANDIINKQEEESKKCRYVVKMTPKSYQYQPNYQNQCHSYVKMAKMSSISNGIPQSPSTSSSSLPYTSSSVSSHSMSSLGGKNYRIRERGLEDYNNHYNAPHSASLATVIYETPSNSSSKIILDSHDESNGDHTIVYEDNYDNTACESYTSEKPHVVIGSGSEAPCAVCGDDYAKLHYGVLACYGCKGFFRRTLTGRYQYVCRFGSNCVVDKYQRNSCRYCRFKRCIDVGMDPKAVRPDRDLTGKQRVPRARKRQIDDELINHIMRLQSDDWSRKIPVEAKVLLTQLLNIESKVSKGDRFYIHSTIHIPSEGTFINVSEKLTNEGNIKNASLRELFEQKPLRQKRTEMCYQPYRMAQPAELSNISHQSAIAAVNWIESLAEIGDFCNTEDKIALVKACYAPLTIFNFSARTAENTKDPDILCLSSYSYVPRKLPPEFNSSNHLSNILIDQTLNDLVSPIRKLNLREEEVVPLKAIIILNPNAKNLSLEAQKHVAELRDRLQDMLFQIIKEIHPDYNTSSRFGNLLLLLPTITTLSSVMSENIQLTKVFGNRTATEPLLNELFGNFSDKANSDVNEPLITSSTSAHTPSPLFKNTVERSLQSTIINSCGYTKTLENCNFVEKTTRCTQTDNSCTTFSSIFHDCLETGSGYNCCSPLNTNLASATKNSFFSSTNIDIFDSLSHSSHPDDDQLNEVVGLNSFASFDETSLLDDCELADSSTFSPEVAAQLFDSNADLFALIQ